MTLSSAATEGKTIHVYFGTSADGIYHAALDSTTGRLGPAQRVVEIGAPGFLTRHPSLPVLYAVASDTQTPVVTAYAIGATGDLSEVSRASVVEVQRGTHIAVHPSGHFLLTAHYQGGAVSLIPLDARGHLGKPQFTRHSGGSGIVLNRQEGPHPHWVGFSPDGHFALVPDLGLDQIIIYRIDLEKPALLPHGQAASVPGGGPRHMRFSTDGQRIYLLNELNMTLSILSWDADSGEAQRLETVPTVTESEQALETFNSGAEVLIHPSAPVVYASNRGQDTVSVFKATPAAPYLERIQVQPIRGAFPRHINLTRDGRWLLAAGADSHTVAVHRVNPENGILTYLRGSIIQVPQPICILFVE